MAGENFLDGTGDKPISWWMFEDSATPSVDGNATNANDLTWTGGGVSRDTGLYQQPSSSAKLTGGVSTLVRSLASVSANFPLKSGAGTAGFTVGGWVYLRSHGNGQIFARFDDLISGGWGFQIISGQKIHMDTPSTAILSDSVIPLNAWTHIVARYNGDNRAGAGANDESSFWVNGAKQSVTLTHANWNLAGDDLVFEAYGSDMNCDEWFAFDVALLDTQIVDIWRHGLDGLQNHSLRVANFDNSEFPKPKIAEAVGRGEM